MGKGGGGKRGAVEKAESMSARTSVLVTNDGRGGLVSELINRKPNAVQPNKPELPVLGVGS